MTVYILGAGASWCTDAYARFTQQRGYIEDFRPPLMADFFRVACTRDDASRFLGTLDPVLKTVGLNLDALLKGAVGCTNLETVVCFLDLLERAIGHWSEGVLKAPYIARDLQSICDEVRGLPIFGGSPEATLERAAYKLRDPAPSSPLPDGFREWQRASWTTTLAADRLLKAICHVYGPVSPYLYPGEAGFAPPCSNYSAFYEQLHARDTVITLNYDFLLDRVLEEKGGLKPASPDEPLPTLFRAPTGGDARFLKLHGSVLWYIRRTPQQRADYYLGDTNAGEVLHVAFRDATNVHNFRGGAQYPLLPAEVDDIRVVPLIVPPTVVKEKSLLQPAIQALWCEAKNALSSAHKVYVIGYSFPPSDTHIRDVLTVQAAARRSPHRSFEGLPITIVTKANASEDEQRGLRERAEHVFPKANIDFARDGERTIGFKEWVKRDPVSM